MCEWFLSVCDCVCACLCVCVHTHVCASKSKHINTDQPLNTRACYEGLAVAVVFTSFGRLACSLLLPTGNSVLITAVCLPPTAQPQV